MPAAAAHFRPRQARYTAPLYRALDFREMPRPKTAPADLEQVVHEALEQLGWQADAPKIAKRVARLDIGMPREDEFAVICGWLGRCDLIHKLDQTQTPVQSRDKYQVPDLLAVFAKDGATIPVLIEVKSKKDQTLSFKPDYLRKLKKIPRGGKPALIDRLEIRPNLGTVRSSAPKESTDQLQHPLRRRSKGKFVRKLGR